MLISSVTFYRCYWPKAYIWLKHFRIKNSKAESFGVLCTLELEPDIARSVLSILPFGAVTDFRVIGEANETSKN